MKGFFLIVFFAISYSLWGVSPLFAQSDVNQEKGIYRNSSDSPADSSKSKIKKKSFNPNPTGALIRSAAFPGWGQFYNHKYIKGSVISVGEGVLIYYFIHNWDKAEYYKRKFRQTFLEFSDAPSLVSDYGGTAPLDENYWNERRTNVFNKWRKYNGERNKFMWFTAAAIFFSMFDAYVDAQLMDFDIEMNEDLKSADLDEITVKLAIRF